jgi:hypothetical protein
MKILQNIIEHYVIKDFNVMPNSECAKIPSMVWELGQDEGAVLIGRSTAKTEGRQVQPGASNNHKVINNSSDLVICSELTKQLAGLFTFLHCKISKKQQSTFVNTHDYQSIYQLCPLQIVTVLSVCSTLDDFQTFVPIAPSWNTFSNVIESVV